MHQELVQAKNDVQETQKEKIQALQRQLQESQRGLFNKRAILEQEEEDDNDNTADADQQPQQQSPRTHIGWPQWRI